MYYKKCLPLKVLDIIFLHESIVVDLQIGGKLCSFISLYRLSNQSHDDFVSFLENFELTLNNLAQKNVFLMVAFRAFNANCSSWYNKDIASNERRKIEAVTSQNGLYQKINELTHILNNSSFRINLVFNSQPNLLIESSARTLGHHQNVLQNLTYSLSTTFWHYQKLNTDLVNCSVNGFDLENTFSNIDFNQYAM